MLAFLQRGEFSWGGFCPPHSLSGARNKKSFKAALEGVDGGAAVWGAGGVGAVVSLEASAEVYILDPFCGCQSLRSSPSDHTNMPQPRDTRVLFGRLST